MTLVWAESFDFYGTNMSILAQRGYGTFSGSNMFLRNNAGLARTGLGYVQVDTTGTSLLGIILNAATNVVGSGVAICPTVIPTSVSANSCGITFGVGTAFNSYRVTINPDLGFSVWEGTTLRGSSAPNLWAINSYYWLEVKAINNAAGGGAFEVRLNGETILAVTGLTIANQFTRVAIGKSTNGGSDACFFDDWIVWDNSGAINNDFLGERRCVTTMPSGDTLEADWTPSTGTSGFAMIDESPPSDADYIQANTAGDISEFSKASIGIDTNDVAGVVVVTRALKTDAGANSFRIGLNSAGFVSNGAEKLPNTTVGYFADIFQRNPNGDIPWTRAAIDAALIRLTRET